MLVSSLRGGGTAVCKEEGGSLRMCINGNWPRIRHWSAPERGSKDFSVIRCVSSLWDLREKTWLLPPPPLIPRTNEDPPSERGIGIGLSLTYARKRLLKRSQQALHKAPSTNQERSPDQEVMEHFQHQSHPTGDPLRGENPPWSILLGQQQESQKTRKQRDSRAKTKQDGRPSSEHGEENEEEEKCPSHPSSWHPFIRRPKGASWVKTSHFFFKFYNRRKIKFRWSLSELTNFLLLLLMVIPIQSEICGNTKIKILGSDIATYFKPLENCTVIQGHLAIYDIADMHPSPGARALSFPKLREITDYFIVYNANAFESLGNLFPNLTVIRGEDLVMNYAFVVTYCAYLHEIGLRSLTHILRGGVRIENNMRLCYVHTINWDIITAGNEGFIHIKRNENRNVCSDYCRDDCPLLKNSLARRACWTKDYCQRVAIPCEEGLSCYQGNDGARGSIEKCSRECLGGCSGPSQEECHSCRHFLWPSQSINYCRSTCPSPFLMFNNWICIDRSECRSKSFILNEESGSRERSYRIYNESCIKECPLGTQQVNDQETGDLTCEKCEFCPKVCPGGKIRSLDDLHQYKECTHIDGDLSINLIGKTIIDGGSTNNNLGKIDGLETNLGKIVNISGRLEITRTFSIVSLDFFKNLRYIKGIHRPTQEKYYSLIILENENIQTLFSFTERPDTRVIITEQEQVKDKSGDLIIRKSSPGKAFIHYNPKLCPQKIVEMIKESQMSTDYDKADISEFTNGDKAICSHYKLHVSSKLSTRGLLVSYDNYQEIIFKQNTTNDIRALLRYEIHYRIVDEATYLKKNLTQFDGRDACGGDYWKIMDKMPSEPMIVNEEFKFLNESVLLTGLQPYTYYAFYVATLMIRDIANRHNIDGAQSDIQYIRTLESKPSQIAKLDYEKIDYSSIKILWKPPKSPNGPISHYEMNITREIRDHNQTMERPYCDPHYKIQENLEENKEGEEEKKKEKLEEKIPSDISNLTSCESCEFCKAPEVIQSEYEKSETDDFLHIVLNTIFTSNSIGEESLLSENEDGGEMFSLRKRRWVKPQPVSRQEPFMQNTIIPGDATEFTVSGLRHYRRYQITLRACHEDTGRLSLKDRCSDDLRLEFTSLNKPGADDIQGKPLLVAHSNSSSEAAWLSWNPPQDPNELIVNYNVKIESKSKESTGIYCITAEEFIKNDYRYSLLIPGAYYVSVQAVSVYGYGDWSESTWVTVKGTSSSIVLYVMIPLLFLFLLAAALLLTYFYFKNHGDSEINISSNPRYMSINSVYKADEWEVPRNSVELLDELGNGCFGMVHKGIFTGVDKMPRPCAVKTVKKGATHHETITFLIEATVMKKFNTTHVVKLLGVVSDGQPHMVILEMMEKGDLRKYLISRRPENANDGQPPPTVREIYQMALEIADGMAYISKQRVVHGDLAARNCMISHDLVVKIGDFGLSHDIYTKGYFRKGDKGMMPVRWMSPEGIRDGVYSPMTDVWSFGIVIWEMVTLGENPYQGLSNDQVYRFIVNRNIMAEPKNCPPSLYTLMKDCWSYNPSGRPSFLDLCSRLSASYANDRFVKESFFYSPEGIAALENQEAERTLQRSERANRLKEVEENASTPLTNNSQTQPPNGSGGSVSVSFAGGLFQGAEPGLLANGGHLLNASSHAANASGGSEFSELNRNLFPGSGNAALLSSKWNKVTTTFMRIRNKSGSTSGEA